MSELNSKDSTQELTLDRIQVGKKAVIQSYSQATDLQGRLKELGLVRGTHILVERFAPLGDPIEIRVRGYHLAIRKKDAAHIVVSLLHDGGENLK